MFFVFFYIKYMFYFIYALALEYVHLSIGGVGGLKV